MWKYDGINRKLVIMGDEKPKRLGKLASKVGGAGKAAVKKKAADAMKTAAKPLTDAVSSKAEEVTKKAAAAIEEKATDMVKKQMKKEAKRKFFGK